MQVPKAVRRLAPDRLRHDPRLRALGVGSGVIPPRAMHSGAERALLESLARGRRTVVEIGVYEGASAAALCRVLPPGAVLTLIDPFGESETSLRPGQRGIARATRRVVARAARGTGVELVWHETRSDEAVRNWSTSIDLLFVDGDHSEAGVRLDWELWSPHVGPGGVLVFHDARATRAGGRGHPGPTRVVDEVFRGPSGSPDGWRIREEVDSMVAVERSSL